MAKKTAELRTENNAETAEVTETRIEKLGDKIVPLKKGVGGFVNTRQFVGLMMLIFSCAAEFASFMLSIEALHKARHPDALFGCDISATISCGKVAESWQAELLHFGQYAVPNAFLGMIFEAVFITIAVLLTFSDKKLKLPNWFMTASQIGNFGCVVFAFWLFFQSSFVILVLCPWCICLMISTTFQFLFQLQYNIMNRSLPLKESVCKKFDQFCDNKLFVMLLVLVAVVILGILAVDIVTLPSRHLDAFGV